MLNENKFEKKIEVKEVKLIPPNSYLNALTLTFLRLGSTLMVRSDLIPPCLAIRRQRWFPSKASVIMESIDERRGTRRPPLSLPMGLEEEFEVVVAAAAEETSSAAAVAQDLQTVTVCSSSESTDFWRKKKNSLLNRQSKFRLIQIVIII